MGAGAAAEIALDSFARWRRVPLNTCVPAKMDGPLGGCRSPVSIQAKAETILRSRGFAGIPPETFERGGREQFIYMLQAGLQPSSKVVDLGCGVLRAGYWLIRFLDEGCYCGIEPHRERLEIGIHDILEPETLGLKSPRFDTNPNFDTSVFRERFDFFLAYSIWTHASKPQIRTMLDSFVRDSTETAVFLVTFLPSSLRY